MDKPTVDSIKAGAYTSAWTFIALFGGSSVGWLSDVGDWASSWGATGSTVDFPSLSVLASAAVAAVAAAGSGFVGTIVRLAQSKISKLPGGPPVYPRGGSS